MLTITKLADAEYLIGQVALGIDDYYVGSGEAPGVWHGDLADELGLVGVVDADALRAVLRGRAPETDGDLLAGRPERRVAAFDVTFSAPKAVSLLWAFAGPEVSSAASIAHVEAVAVALDFLEWRAGATRQQVDGERQRTSTGMAVATFVHRTSREGDPQLHSHCVVANLGRRPHGTYAALDAAPLYEWGKAAGSVYQEELRRRLTERLGVAWGANRNGCREIEGFEHGWLRTFSKRTVAIEEHLAGAGPENPSPAMRMRADDAASLATRPSKNGSFTAEDLRERWQTEADEAGLPTGHALEAQVTGRALAPPALEWDDVVTALVDQEDGLCAHRPRFKEAHVVERASPPSAAAASTSRTSSGSPPTSSFPARRFASWNGPAGARRSTPRPTTWRWRSGSSTTSTGSSTPGWPASTRRSSRKRSGRRNRGSAPTRPTPFGRCAARARPSAA